jgi:hypothetical protein
MRSAVCADCSCGLKPQMTSTYRPGSRHSGSSDVLSRRCSLPTLASIAMPVFVNNGSITQQLPSHTTHCTHTSHVTRHSSHTHWGGQGGRRGRRCHAHASPAWGSGRGSGSRRLGAQEEQERERLARLAWLLAGGHVYRHRQGTGCGTGHGPPDHRAPSTSTKHQRPNALGARRSGTGTEPVAESQSHPHAPSADW